MRARLAADSAPAKQTSSSLHPSSSSSSTTTMAPSSGFMSTLFTHLRSTPKQKHSSYHTNGTKGAVLATVDSPVHTQHSLDEAGSSSNTPSKKQFARSVSNPPPPLTIPLQTLGAPAFSAELNASHSLMLPKHRPSTSIDKPNSSTELYAFNLSYSL